MHGEGISSAYGLWSLVVVNVGLFSFFITSSSLFDNAIIHEDEMIKLFGDDYGRYMEKTPMFVPKVGDRLDAPDKIRLAGQSRR